MPKGPEIHRCTGYVSKAERKRISDANRPSSRERGYTHRWDMASRAYLCRHPLCVTCGAAATVTDHIIPHKGDRILFWDMDNWQALCERCHNRKTAKEDGGFGR